MIGTESIKYSLKNLSKRKARSLLTVLSIFIGIATIFIFISFGLGLYSYVQSLASEAGVDKFFVQGKVFTAPGTDQSFRLEDEDLQTVQKANGVKEAIGWYMNVAQIKQGTNIKYVFLGAYDPTTENTRLLNEGFTIGAVKGRDLKVSDKGKVVLGYNYQLANKIFEKPYNLGGKIEINGENFEIVGFEKAVGNPNDDSNIYMHEDDFKRLYESKNLSYAIIFGRVSDPAKLDQAVENVKKDLRKERGLKEGNEDFFVRTFQDAIEQFSSALNIIIGFILLIAFVSVIVSAINTANTMVTSVLERVREIGIMKSVGARNSEVRNIFLFESSFLGLIAGIIGVILGFGLSELAGAILSSLGWGFLMPSHPWYLFLGLIIFATLIGTISGVTVAIQASRQNPVDALRYE